MAPVVQCMASAEALHWRLTSCSLVVAARGADSQRRPQFAYGYCDAKCMDSSGINRLPQSKVTHGDEAIGGCFALRPATATGDLRLQRAVKRGRYPETLHPTIPESQAGHRGVFGKIRKPGLPTGVSDAGEVGDGEGEDTGTGEAFGAAFGDDFGAALGATGIAFAGTGLTGSCRAIFNSPGFFVDADGAADGLFLVGAL
eukprot:s990_g20.t1